MFSRLSKSISLSLVFLILAGFVLFLQGWQVLAQEDCKNKEECETILKQYEEEIAKYEKVIGKTEQEKKTLQNQISVLKNKVQKLEVQIKQNNLMIKDVTLQIKDTEKSIDKTSSKIEDSKGKLADILRTIYEEDQRPLIEIFFSESNLSDFFNNLMALESLNSENQRLLKNIQGLKENLVEQKNSLDSDKEDLEKLAKMQLLQKQESESTKKEKDQLLKLTEAQYQQSLAEKKIVEKKAAEIRAKLFGLIGVVKAPTFGEALEIAKSVSSLIGIRPAFLLAIISQESAIGRNVGQCILTDSAIGTGKRISTGASVSRLMKPSRDVQPFLSITAALGRDPYNTAVSCPLSVGYGGAMGPAQFIPSTWNLYAEKLKTVLGRSGDPWAINDSFTAAAVYLSELGASAQTAAKESRAASRYYGGSSSYARSVMSRANCIQSFVDNGTMSSSCESLIF